MEDVAITVLSKSITKDYDIPDPDLLHLYVTRTLWFGFEEELIWANQTRWVVQIVFFLYEIKKFDTLI